MTKRHPVSESGSATELLEASDREEFRLTQELANARARRAAAVRRGDRSAVDDASQDIEQITGQLAREVEIREAAAPAAREERERAALARFTMACDEAVSLIEQAERDAKAADDGLDVFVCLQEKARESARTALSAVVESCPDRDLQARLRGMAAPDEGLIRETLFRRLRGAGFLTGIGQRRYHTDDQARLTVITQGLRGVLERARQSISEGGQP